MILYMYYVVLIDSNIHLNLNSFIKEFGINILISKANNL